MLPPLKIVKAGLRRTTEALAVELSSTHPGSLTPDWSPLEWQLAAAAAAAHGVSPLLCGISTWQNTGWRAFLQRQREHVVERYRRIAQLLERIDSAARARAVAIVPLKGSALHAYGIYEPGERPMADIDLLVHEADTHAAIALLEALGYSASFTSWKHLVFKPAASRSAAALGEHRDNQITIELHTRIRERLPATPVEITARIYPAAPEPGLNPYPSSGALMSHLLLHTAGNIRGRSVRLLHLIDIARLAARLTEPDWHGLWDERTAEFPWWALPPLSLTARYFRNAIPAWVLARLESGCPPVLRMLSRHQSLTQASCSALWIEALAGMEWCRTFREAGRYLRHRFVLSEEGIQERAAVMRTQPFMQGQEGSRLKRGRLILARLTGPVPRMDTLHVVGAALEQLL
jgi:Uncharacterised nucleotidyltransferase